MAILDSLPFNAASAAADIPGMRTAELVARLASWTSLALILTQPAWAGRDKIEEVPYLPAPSLLPAAGAPAELGAPILSGLDYSAIAPPGVRLRVVEDEPYSYLLGTSSRGAHVDITGTTRILLRADTSATSWFEAEISMRYTPTHAATDLRLSFDTAAHLAYMHAMLAPELRGPEIYSLSEVRSPLGLDGAKDRANGWREYLAYSAAVLNPNSSHFVDQPTPYQYVRGELRTLHTLRSGDYLLCIIFSAQDFPNSLTLTENLARGILNLLRPHPKTALPFLAYYPDYERAIPYFPGEPIDPRTADLAERPGEGCGLNPQNITGDICPQCAGQGPFWPAQPYRDAEFGQRLPPLPAFIECSKLLLQPWLLGLPRAGTRGAGLGGDPSTPFNRMLDLARAGSGCSQHDVCRPAGSACGTVNPCEQPVESGSSWVHRGDERR